MLQHPEPLSSQQMQHHSGTGVWLRLLSCKLRNSHARQQVHWQGTSETGMCFFRAVLGQGRWRQTEGQELSCLWAGWRARLQSLPPGLDIHDYNIHKVPALSALGLGNRKLCLALRVYFYPATCRGASILFSQAGAHTGCRRLPTADQRTTQLQSTFTAVAPSSALSFVPRHLICDPCGGNLFPLLCFRAQPAVEDAPQWHQSGGSAGLWAPLPGKAAERAEQQQQPVLRAALRRVSLPSMGRCCPRGAQWWPNQSI